MCSQPDVCEWEVVGTCARHPVAVLPSAQPRSRVPLCGNMFRYSRNVPMFLRLCSLEMCGEGVLPHPQVSGLLVETLDTPHTPAVHHPCPPAQPFLPRASVFHGRGREQIRGTEGEERYSPKLVDLLLEALMLCLLRRTIVVTVVRGMLERTFAVADKRRRLLRRP